jgi:hypothetical protein
MLMQMRTTINLPDALAEAAKDRAKASGRTFTSLVEEGLRAVLAQAPGSEAVPPLPAFGRPDGRILVDLADRDAVWDVLDTAADTATTGDRDGTAASR